MKHFWSIRDIAEYLDVEYKTIYRLVRKGEIPAGKVGGVYRIRKEDVDAYFEHRKATALLEAYQMDEVDPEEWPKCTVCLRLLTDEGGIGGQCEHEACKAPICQTCWSMDNVHHCADHRPSVADRLAKAQEQLTTGEIPLLVSAIEARQREVNLISRFDRKVHHITTFRHPIDGRAVRIDFSWSDVHTRMDESDRLMDLLRTGYLDREVESEMPLNIASRYIIPADKLGGLGVILEARVLSHLPSMVQQGFDTRPAGQTEVLHVLEGCIKMAGKQNVAYVVGLASTTGWHPEALAYVDGSIPGRSFSHRLVVPCLVDLHEMTLIYNQSDARSSSLASLFAPRLPAEEIDRAVARITQALLASSGVTVEEIVEDAGVDRSHVRAAFERLVEEGTHRLEDVPAVGSVLVRVSA